MTFHGLVDTHAHICDTAFDEDREAVLERAHDAGIVAVIAVAETLEDAEKNLALARAHSMILPAAGLFPAHLDYEEATVITEWILKERGNLIAIGEVGLDFWLVQDEADREVQREIFRGFIKLANKTGLPLNVHSRSAGRHVVAMLLDNGAEKVQLHAFDGKSSTALPAVECGWFFSMPPSLVRSRQKQKLVKQLPLSCMLLESDSPVLGPEPSVRNELSNLPLVLRAIAEIKGVPLDGVVEAIAENTDRLYGDLGKYTAEE